MWQASERINDDSPSSLGVRGHVACHLSVLVRSGAVMMCWAGPVQNRVKGTRVDRKLNAPTVPCPQTNIWMSEPTPHPEREGYRDQRGAMAVSGVTSELLLF